MSLDEAGEARVTLRWRAAEDDVSSASAIRYRLYLPSFGVVSRAQGTTQPGATELSLPVTRGVTYYFLVRAVDEAGNEDSNLVVRSLRVPLAGLDGGPDAPPADRPVDSGPSEDVVIPPDAGKSPAVESVDPPERRVGVGRTAPVTIRFTAAMNPATLIAPSVTGACTGSVHLSRDDFTVCVGGTLDAIDPMTFVFTPTGVPLAPYTTYRLRVTSAAQDRQGRPLAPEYVSEIGYRTGPNNAYSKTVFIGGLTNGNMGGVAGADAICQNVAPNLASPARR